MTDFSTTPVSDLIGALELGDLRRFDDAALESASGHAAVGPTTGCPPAPTIIMCRRIDDDALEAAAEQLASGPTQMACFPTQLCPRIGDDVLEAATAEMGPQPTLPRRFPGGTCLEQ